MTNYEQYLAESKGIINDKVSTLETAASNKRENLIGKSTSITSPILGNVNGTDFYDADSPYSPTNIQQQTNKNTIRLGDITSSIYEYVDAPEAPDTIKHKQNREATPQEIANYRASIMAKNNFAAGMTAASKESYDDIKQNPLTEENWKLYEEYVNPYLESLGKNLELRGQEGKLGIHGRQVAQVFNPQGVNPEESLQERLLNTGVAVLKNQGKEKTNDIFSKSTRELVTQDRFKGKDYLTIAKELNAEGNLTKDIAQELANASTTIGAIDDIRANVPGNRTWGEAVTDTGKQFGSGTARFGANLVDMVYGLTTGDMNNPVSENLYETAKSIQDTYSKALKSTNAKIAADTAKIDGEFSKAMFKIKENIANPMVIGQLVTESLPMMIGAMAGGSAVAAKFGLSAINTLRTALGIGALQQGTDIAREVNDAILDTGPNRKISEEDWQNNTAYQKYLKEGMTAQEAKEQVALDTARAVGGASAALSYVANRFIPTGHAIEDTLLGLKNTAKKNLIKTTAGESAVEVVEESGGKIAQNLGVQNLNPEQGTFEDVGITAADAATAGGATNIGINGPGAVSDAFGTAKEYLNDKTGTSADTTKGEFPNTSAARKNRWETIEQGVEVAPEARTGWSKAITEHARDLWLTQGKDTEYATNLVKIMDDAVEKLAQINKIESAEGKEVLAGELARQLHNSTKNLPLEDRSGITGMLKSVADKFSGNKYVERALERAYEDELKTKFEDVKARLAKEGVTDLSNTGLLTQQELESLEKTLVDMRTLGSEKLTQLANDIENGLEARQVRLGSERDGNTLPPKKNAEQVRNEIETIGFLTEGKKSLRQHRADLDAYVIGKDREDLTQIEKSDKKETLDALSTFVASRDGKVNLVATDDKGNKRLRSIGEIKKFATYTIEDNEKLLEVLTDTLKGKLDNESKTVIEGNIKYLQDVQNNLKRTLEMIARNTTKDDIAVYGKYSTIENEAFVKEQVKKYSNTWEQTRRSAPTSKTIEEPAPEEAEKITLEDKTVKEETPVLPVIEEDESTYKTAKEELVPLKVENKPPVPPIKAGKSRYDEIDELLMAYSSGNSKTIGGGYVENVTEEAVTNEDVRKGTIEKGIKAATIRDLLPVIHGTRLNNYYKVWKKFKDNKFNTVAISPTQRKVIKELSDLVETLKKEPTIANEVFGEDVSIDDSPLIPTVARQEGLIETVEAAVEVIEEAQSVQELAEPVKAIGNSIDEHIKAIEELQQSKAFIKAKLDGINQELTDHLKEMRKQQKIKNKLEKEIDTIAAEKEAVENREIASIAKKLAKTFLSAIRKISDRLVKVYSTLGEMEVRRQDLTQEKRDLKEALSKVIEQIDVEKKALKAAQKAETKAIRQAVEDVINADGKVIVKDNESKKNSFTAALLKADVGNATTTIMKLMPRIIMDSENGTERVEKAINSLREFTMNRRSKSGKRLIDQRVGSIGYESKNPLIGTLDGLFNTPEIERTVEVALNVASVVTMKTMIDVRSMPSTQLEEFVNGAFGNLWAENDSTQEIEKETVANWIRSGKIIPMAPFAQNAGREFLKQLELKLDDSMTIQQVSDIEVALGNIVINNLLEGASGNAKYMNNKVTKAVVRKEIDKPITRGEAGNAEGLTGNVIRVLDLGNLSRDRVREFSEMGSVLEFADEKQDMTISLDPITHRLDKTTRNGDMPVGKEVVQYLNDQGSMAWKFDASFEKVWDEAGRNIDKLKELILGRKEDVIKTTHAMDIESELAKYTADELDIERMAMAYELVKDKEFYIGWDYTVSNRNMMANRWINPQNSKISRFIVSAKDMRNEIVQGKVKAGDVEHMNIAIAQALDMDPDKDLDETVIKNLAAKEVKLVEKDGRLEATYPEGSKLEKVVNSDKPLEALREVYSSETKMLGSNHIMHMYQVVELLKNIKDGVEKFSTNLALEADGITNGMTSTVAQIGLNRDTERYFEKGGYYIDGVSQVKSHGEFKQDGKDFYETPIETLQTNLGWGNTDMVDIKDVVTKLVDPNGKGNSAWRSFLKPLVMVFVYGASTPNITRHASTALVTKAIKQGRSVEEITSTIEKLVNNGLQDEKNPAFRKYIEFTRNLKKPMITKKSYDEKLGRLVEDSNGDFTIDPEALNIVVAAINSSVGSAIGAAFAEEFGVITQYRSALKIVNELNYLVSDIAFRTELNGKQYSDLTREQLKEVKSKLRENGTYYGSTNAMGQTQDYFKTDTARGYEAETITVRLPSANAKFQSNSNANYNSIINRVVKDIASNVGAVGVIDIHSIDGTTMIRGHIKDVLNIFDALVLGTNSELNKEQMEEINKIYYELNMQHSVLGNAVDRLVKNAKVLINGNISKGTMETLIADFQRISGIKDTGKLFNGKANLKTMFASVLDTLETVDKGRRELVGKNGIMNQYYISETMPGYKFNGKIPTTRFAVFSNDPEIAAKERNTLDTLFNTVLERVETGAATKIEAGNKVKFDIIAGIDTLVNNVVNVKDRAKMQAWLKKYKQENTEYKDC